MCTTVASVDDLQTNCRCADVRGLSRAGCRLSGGRAGTQVSRGGGGTAHSCRARDETHPNTTVEKEGQRPGEGQRPRGPPGGPWPARYLYLLFSAAAKTARRRLWCSRGPWPSPRTPVHPGVMLVAIPPSSRASPDAQALRYVPKLRTLPLWCRVFVRMPMAATAEVYPSALLPVYLALSLGAPHLSLPFRAQFYTITCG